MVTLLRLQVSVKVIYVPRNTEEYSASASLFLGGMPGEAQTTELLALELTGAGRHPRLKFDKSALVLPAVPLNVRSTGLFYINNDGYDNLELRFRLPADSDNVPLSLEFPEGAMIGIAKERLPVVVSFKTDKATSFTANIDFLDQDGTCFCFLYAPLLSIARLEGTRSATMSTTQHYDGAMTRCQLRC